MLFLSFPLLFLLTSMGYVFMFLPETAPCGPVAFWAFRDHVSNSNALKIAQRASVTLRDEIGCTMLHRAVAKRRPEGSVCVCVCVCWTVCLRIAHHLVRTCVCVCVCLAFRNVHTITAGKVELVQTLLDRGINVASRDWEGSTARDYITIYNVEDGDTLRQVSELVPLRHRRTRLRICSLSFTHTHTYARTRTHTQTQTHTPSYEEGGKDI